TIAALIVPTAAFAGEADVRLNFSSNDKTMLYVSLGIGILTVIGAFLLRSAVLKRSPGSAKMQEVGGAIKEGALAYLTQQIRLMIVFVVILGLGLFFLFHNFLVPITFVAGVAASYIAGYWGMRTAVDGNMRTAHAALTSYKNALEIAFRSGAVAGLITVGMGLSGATLILLFGGSSAMTLLVGFGFGGSLAALFMRVGGGIFTKAADVGADLVGKVEAGIPEDDPRNPATIADNVGDNVGDCAGMAADVFESYEVTLVAAIVLGAATASIFDEQTWMKLILFALMARGIGIIASVIGIFSVKGTDDVDADPLKRIRSGFYSSAGVAAVFTLALSWWMMGGTGAPIRTSKLISGQEKIKANIVALQSELNGIAKTKKIATYAVSDDDIKATQTFKDMKLNPMIEQQLLSFVRTAKADQLDGIKPLEGYKMVDPATSENPVLDFAVLKEPQTGTDPEFISMKEALTSGKFKVVAVRETMSQGGPTPAIEQMNYTLTGDLEGFKKSLTANPNPQMKREMVGEPMNPTLFVKSDTNDVAFGIDQSISPFSQAGGLAFFRETPAEMKNIFGKMKTDPQTKMPARETAALNSIEHATVPWYMFFAAIFFGLIMAFIIEALTDYYVSTHKKPVQEVAGVSSAGPAPMIIQGFAYAAESSVFMVFGIVMALIAPLFFFPPTMYGGYILSFYGVALVGLGLLTTTGYVLAMDTFGPISDNAQGVFEMSGDGHDNEYGSKAVQRLDAAGNTTKALTKGFAIATAVVAAVALFHSYLEDAKLGQMGIRLDLPEIFLGFLIGAAAPYLFSASTINAVGRASFQLINEVRRQFRNDPGIMAGTSKPNYGACVSIVTAAAQKELLGPGILAIALPVAVAFGFSIGKPQTNIGGEMFNLTGAQALGGFLAGAIASGQLMAVLLANSGGMWDNAKKLIEDGLYGGKGTEAHKAGVVCDTVGDPFKDTAGPALNPLIKVMNLVALLLAPVVIKPFDNPVLGIITAVAVGALAVAIYISKKGSMSTALQAATDENPAQVPTTAAIEEKARRRITVEDAEDEADKV
ncbi:MAG: sodium/proton-translocating pyrophosphatase, partial [Fimbriimonadaceae bacterium]|nr:sodium/proton-translocating pyrophosphatase [Fimbriimonadaceae bacterium]